MSQLGLILAVALVTYATRLAGFALAARARSDNASDRAVTTSAATRFLAYVPVAAFAALVVPGLTAGPGDLPARLCGAATAALAVWRAGHLWAGLAAGMAAYWLARALLGG
jgi:branched-subunit amino acid transport protein